MTDGASEYFVLFHHKVLVACAVEVRHRKPGTAQDKRKDGRYAGRVRLAIVPDRSAKSLCGFVENAVAPGTLTVTDDWSDYASPDPVQMAHLDLGAQGFRSFVPRFQKTVRHAQIARSDRARLSGIYFVVLDPERDRW